MKKQLLSITLLLLSVINNNSFAQTIPEAAREKYIMAIALRDQAKNASDYDSPITKFKDVIALAPSWAEAYKELGLTLELAGKFDEAISNLTKYISFNPPADDARKAQDEIYIIKAKKEKKENEVNTKPTDYTYTFYDDFSNNNNYWPTNYYNATEGISSIANGRLDILAKNGYYNVIKNFKIYRTKDFEVEVTAKLISGNNHFFGIEFCSDNNLRSRYAIGISGTGYYNLMYKENGGNWIEDQVFSLDIIQGYSLNVLKIIKKDNFIMFYVNNKLLQKYNFAGGYGSDFGVFVSAGSEVQFSTFKLSGEKQ